MLRPFISIARTFQLTPSLRFRFRRRLFMGSVPTGSTYGSIGQGFQKNKDFFPKSQSFLPLAKAFPHLYIGNAQDGGAMIITVTRLEMRRILDLERVCFVDGIRDEDFFLIGLRHILGRTVRLDWRAGEIEFQVRLGRQEVPGP